MSTTKRVTLRSVGVTSGRQLNTATRAVAAEVRAEFARRAVSHVAVANALGVTPMYLSRRMRGVVAFDVEELAAIAQLLECDVADLLPPSTSYTDPVQQIRKRAAAWAPRGSNPQPTDYKYAGCRALEAVA